MIINFQNWYPRLYLFSATCCDDIVVYDTVDHSIIKFVSWRSKPLMPSKRQWDIKILNLVIGHGGSRGWKLKQPIKETYNHIFLCWAPGKSRELKDKSIRLIKMKPMSLCLKIKEFLLFQCDPKPPFYKSPWWHFATKPHFNR